MASSVVPAAATPNEQVVPGTRHCRSQRGVALLVVLVILLVIGGSSASFIWFMNQQQTRAGVRYRSASAMAVAEAGVHQALSILEALAPDGGPGRAWRPAAYTELMRVAPFEGRFTLSVSDDAGGAVVVTSVGEVGGMTRRLRARVYLASSALLVALDGASFIRLEKPPTATILLPYGAGIGDRPWIPIAAGRGIWLATSDVSINDPSADIGIGPGPLDAPAAAGHALIPPRPMPIRLALARGAELMLDPGQQRVDVQQLRVLGSHIEGAVLRTEALRQIPEVDRPFYQALAAANTSNASLNSAAGRFVGDRDLEQKLDSLYSQREFQQLQTYLKAGLLPPRLAGVVYIKGRVAVGEGEQIQIAEGALVAEGTVYVSQRASLEITHSAATRTLPGVIVLDPGALVVRGARLRVHGLVYANGIIDIGEGAHLDIVGSVLGADRRMSFRNSAGTVVIRYDPAVLGTPGLRQPVDAPIVAWVSAWEELP